MLFLVGRFSSPLDACDRLRCSIVALSFGFPYLLCTNLPSHKRFAFKVKNYKKTSRATSALDTSVVLESVLI